MSVRSVRKPPIHRDSSSTISSRAALEDSSNPAFVVNAENVSCREKTLFVLSQRWCWGIIFLVLVISTFFNTVLVIFRAKQDAENFTVQRVDWGAQEALQGLRRSRLPVSSVTQSFTNDLEESCTTKDECSARMLKLQTLYMNIGLCDIPWNFVIGDDGLVYEGRGFWYQPEIPGHEIICSGSTLSNTESVGAPANIEIAFFGTFTDSGPSSLQKSTFNSFIANSMRRDMIRVNHTQTPVRIRDPRCSSSQDETDFLFPHANCEMYYSCSLLEYLVTHSCTPGLHFSPTLEDCVLPEDAGCDPLFTSTIPTAPPSSIQITVPTQAFS